MAAAGGGRFITVEGGEGVGKSLFTANLAKALRSLGHDLVTTREPGGTPAADKIRELFAAPPLGDPLLPKTEALLVSAARAQHVGRLIRPALAAGQWVLCDRYVDSMRVYQGILGSLNRDVLEELVSFSVGETQPELTFWLDCEVNVALARLAAGRRREKTPVERYDQADVDVHERLRLAFRSLAAAEPERIVRINAAQTPEAMIKDAMRVIGEHFGG